MNFHPIETVPRDGTPVILRDLAGNEVCAEIRYGNVSIRGTSAPRPRLYGPTGKLSPLIQWRAAVPSDFHA